MPTFRNQEEHIGKAMKQGRVQQQGGITTIIEMPLNQLPATVDRESIQIKFDAAAGKLSVDAAQFGGLVSYNLDRLLS